MVLEEEIEGEMSKADGHFKMPAKPAGIPDVSEMGTHEEQCNWVCKARLGVMMEFQKALGANINRMTEWVDKMMTWMKENCSNP